MPKYVNAEDLMNWLYAQKLLTTLDNGDKAVFDTYIKVQKVLLTLDTVNLVRCKDCKYFCKEHKKTKWGACDHDAGLVVTWPDSYCSYGERKETDA